VSESPYIVLGAYLPPRAAWVLSRVVTLRHLEELLDDAGVGGAMEREALEAWAAIVRVGTLAVSADESKPAPATETGLLSTEEAGIRLGVTDARVRQLARSGVLPARQVSGRWMYEAADVERLAAERKAV
jgi:hypothetical protein